MTSTSGTEPVLMSDGFRERGQQVTRLEAFVDAAFAFSLTMLVISTNDIPKSIPDMIVALKGVPAFAACFLQIALFWHAHVRWSRRYGLDDRRSTVLGLLLVFLVLIYIYPLRILFGTFFSWISGGWLPSSIAAMTSLRELDTMFMVYAVAFGTMSLVIAALFSHALARRKDLGMSVDEAVLTAGEVASWRLSAAVAAVSFCLACFWPRTEPAWMIGLPGLIYFVLNFSWIVRNRIESRVRLRYQREGVE